MPFFVAIDVIDTPAVSTGGYDGKGARLLRRPFATREAAERAAMRQAVKAQEWPWTAVYVVEAVNRRVAWHKPDPNDRRRQRALADIFMRAANDPEHRVPDRPVQTADQRLSAFQLPPSPAVPYAPDGTPTPAFAERVISKLLAAAATAGFDFAPGLSAECPGLPQFLPTPAAMRRLAAETWQQRRDGQVSASAASPLERLMPHADDVWGVQQEFEVYPGRDMRHTSEIAEVAIMEARADNSIDDLLRFGRAQHERRRQRLTAAQRQSCYEARRKESPAFRSGRVLVGVVQRNSYEEGEEEDAAEAEAWAALLAFLTAHLGPPTESI